jgi:geranylgeranyl diphosphate synthase type I
MSLLLAAGDLPDDLEDGDLNPESVGGAAGAAELMAALLTRAGAALQPDRHAGLRADRMARAHAFMSRLQLRALAGQGRDLELSGDAGATLDDALQATAGKSGALGRCAAMMGAALATDDGHLIGVAGRFGELVATARQLLNDIAGVWPGGAASTDIALARKTPPVAFALAVDPASNAAAGRVRAALAQSPDERARADPLVRADIVSSGGVYYTWVLATVCGQRARRAAAELCPGRPDLDPSWIIEP